MSVCDDIKKLVERLRSAAQAQAAGGGWADPCAVENTIDWKAADALEAMAEKLQRETKAAGYWMERFCASENERDQMLIDLEEYRRDVAKLTEERDRLKAALETIAEGRDSGRHDGLPEEHPAHSAVLMHYIACEALEGREWEWFRNEKVAGQDTAKPEAIERSTPATDPAPVCEWTRTPWGRAPSASPGDALYTPRCDADYLCNVPGSGMCHRCGLPIKFTETEG